MHSDGNSASTNVHQLAKSHCIALVPQREADQALSEAHSVDDTAFAVLPGQRRLSRATLWPLASRNSHRVEYVSVGFQVKDIRASLEVACTSQSFASEVADSRELLYRDHSR